MNHPDSSAEKLSTDDVGQVFYYNHGHDILVKYYSDGHWGPISDSLTAIDAVFDSYAEQLVENRGLHSRIEASNLISAILYTMIHDSKCTNEQFEIYKKDLKTAVEEYKRLTKLYP